MSRLFYFFSTLLVYHSNGFPVSNLKNQLTRSTQIFSSNSDIKEFWKQKESLFYSELGLAKLNTLEKAAEKISFSNTDINIKDKTSINSTSLLEPRSTPTTVEYKNIISNSSSSKNISDSKIPLPFFNVDSIGLGGRWEEISGNFVLRPANDKSPIGVIHFLGGAFVGAAPHIAYRYLLDSLCERGYVIVATPYRLEMDYIESCDKILSKFDAVAIKLASQYGPVPVIGLGHSCGALLQTLITCLFPDTPRAANILISFNNKPVTAAIPAFEEIVLPLSEQLMGTNERSQEFRNAIKNVRTLFDQTLITYSKSQFSPSYVAKEIIPLLNQGLEIVDQLPDLLKEISSGKTEFQPTPIDTKEVCRRMYRARRTLLIKFENDAFDESIEIEKVLREANTIMRMKRPMVQMQCELRTLTGTHITPLTQNIIIDPPVEIPEVIDIFRNTRSQLRDNFLKTVNDVSNEILVWLDGSMNAS